MGITPQAAADLFRRQPDRWLDLGVGEIAYRRVGSGPDVLFVHGWPVSGATFRTLLPDLVDHVDAAVVPGRTLGGHPGRRFFSHEERPADVAAALVPFLTAPRGT